MIGIHAPEARQFWVEEFFQLFKTPWEFARAGETYLVEICFETVPDDRSDRQPMLTLVFSAHRLPIDETLGAEFHDTAEAGDVSWAEDRIPIYRGMSTFAGSNTLEALEGPDGYPAGFVTRADAGRLIVRLGFDPLEEMEFLFTQGQPEENAPRPTLELHFDLIRTLIVDAGLEHTEIPPSPAGFDHTCCLTHDVDFLGLRRHGLDRTAVGFLSRATAGSIFDAFSGKRTWGEVGSNWIAALKLPLVWGGIASDPWRPFAQYRRADGDLPSTFFVLPFKKRPGRSFNGRQARNRAVAYDVDDIPTSGDDAPGEHVELALHGIDAWHDVESATQERNRMKSLAPNGDPGIRMHWLYFDEDSPARLDEAGFDYDSTFGYNSAVGFRAGTGQPFRLPETERLLEIPLVVQDTAMFYRNRMGLTPKQATAAMDELIGTHRRFGGVLTVNWHERSLAPERLWNRPYRHLLDELQREKVWFARMRDVAQWYRRRRSLRFEGSEQEKVQDDATLSDRPRSGAPALAVGTRATAPPLRPGLAAWRI